MFVHLSRSIHLAQWQQQQNKKFIYFFFFLKKEKKKSLCVHRSHDDDVLQTMFSPRETGRVIKFRKGRVTKDKTYTKFGFFPISFLTNILCWGDKILELFFVKGVSSLIDPAGHLNIPTNFMNCSICCWTLCWLRTYVFLGKLILWAPI